MTAVSVQRQAADALSLALEHAPSEIDREAVAVATARTDAALSAEERKREIRKVKDAALATLMERAELDRPQAEEAINAAAAVGDELADSAVDLGAIMREGVPPVEYLEGPLARGLVYVEGVTGLAGHPEVGKTLLALRLAVDAMRAGRHVVWMDYENGEHEAVRKLEAVGADPALISERLTYVAFPGKPDWDKIGRHWDRHPGALGLWDSTRGILKALGLKENEAEAGTFADDLVAFSLARNAPAILLDHVTKAETGSTGYARGSGDKLASVQAQWYVKALKPFSEAEIGEVELQRWKARSGHMAYRHRLLVGDGNGRATFRRANADETPDGRTETAIIEYLKASNPATLSLHAIETNVEGKGTRVRELTKALADAEDRPVKRVKEGQHDRYAYAAELDAEPRKAARLEL